MSYDLCQVSIGDWRLLKTRRLLEAGVYLTPGVEQKFNGSRIWFDEVISHTGRRLWFDSTSKQQETERQQLNFISTASVTAVKFRIQ